MSVLIDEIEVEVDLAYELDSLAERLRDTADSLRQAPFCAVVERLAAINADLSRALAEGIEKLLTPESEENRD